MGKLKSYQKIRQVNDLRKEMKSKQKKLEKQIFTSQKSAGEYNVSVSMLGNRQTQHVHVKDQDDNLVVVVNQDILDAIAQATTDVLNQIGTARDQLFSAATKALVDENSKTKTINKELQAAQKDLNKQNFKGFAHLKASENQPTVSCSFKGTYECTSIDAINTDDLSTGKLSRLLTRSINAGVANIDLATDVIYDKYAH